MHDDAHGNRKPGPLNLDIYSALLGGRPRIAPQESIAQAETSPPRAASRKRPKITLPMDDAAESPFLDAELRDQLGRCVAQAARVLADVRSRVVGVFQESTIGKRDKRPMRRADVTIGDAARHRDDATRAA